MSLLPGLRLGPYEIVSPLGKGGMGEVYRARDTRLERMVAIKVLPAAFTASDEARQRFEREAKAVSRLTHRHVCALYDVGRDGEVDYLVMELLDGETLAARLARGPLKMTEAARIGAEIADALAVAHAHGIVHRDLKPGNVMITKAGVKLLDFGLAMASPPLPGGAGEAATRSGEAPLTEQGQWIGTLPYMSPEQLEHRPVDARSDIFALGLILYEMAAGRRAFAGVSALALASAILHQEPPPLSSVRAGVPPTLAQLVHACLAKDPDARWQSARDAAVTLAAMPVDGDQRASGARRRPWMLWAVSAVAVVALGAVALQVWRASGSAAVSSNARVELQIVPPVRAFYYSVETIAFSLSPDGHTLAFVAPNASAVRQVWIRQLESIAATAVAGTEGAQSVLWSPDGRSIAFFGGAQLKRLELPGGPAVSICAVRSGIGYVGDWRGSDILFASIEGENINRVSVADGKVTAVMTPDQPGGETRMGFPSFLPDGRRFLYTARRTDGTSSLMVGEAGKPSQLVMPIESNAQYVEPGLLVFARDGTLVGQRFDPVTARVSGQPFAIADAVRFFWSTATATFSASSRAIVLQSHRDRARIAWVDRTGREARTLATPGPLLDVRLVAGGKALFSRALATTGTYDVWSLDLERGTESRLTESDRGTEMTPVLLPGGQTMLYSESLGGAPRLTRRDLGNRTPPVIVLPGPRLQSVSDLSPDGRVVAYEERSAKGDFDTWTMPVNDPSAARALEQTDREERDLRFSPDGRFYSFMSNLTGRMELYVAALAGGAKTRVSTDGVILARWNPAGGELLYVSRDSRMMSVPIVTSPSLRVGTPSTLFAVPRPWIDFDVAADGQRFLAAIPEVFGVEQPMTAILNWRPAVR